MLKKLIHRIGRALGFIVVAAPAKTRKSDAADKRAFWKKMGQSVEIIQQEFEQVFEKAHMAETRRKLVEMEKEVASFLRRTMIDRVFNERAGTAKDLTGKKVKAKGIKLKKHNLN